MMIARVLGAIVHMFSPLIALVTLLLGYLETLFQWRRLTLDDILEKSSDYDTRTICSVEFLAAPIAYCLVLHSFMLQFEELKTCTLFPLYTQMYSFVYLQ